MTEVSSIVLRADVADIQRASSELDKFQQSAEKSAKAADSFGDSNKTASSKTDELTESVNETHRKMREFAERLRASEIASASLGAKQDKLAESLFKQIDAIKSVEGATARLNAIQAEIGQSRRKGALDEGNYATLLAETRTKLSQVEKAETVLGQVRVNFLSRLKEQVAAQRLSKDELLRYKAAQLGVSSSAEIYIKKLSESNGALNRLKTNSISMRRELGMLAAQLARGDISGLRSSSITLAGRSGLLEQLTSLRGLAIGGVFAGIAGGIFAVSKAYLEGSKESQEYNKQLILTGHYAGQTTGQLQEMARVLSGSGITQSKMAESLAKVIGSGAFYGGDIGVVAGVAARMERAIGQSIDETVKQFQRLSDEPAKAVQELDKSLHFLTATQLDNILALENQGRASEAAKIAMNAYASEMNKRTSEIAENLGWLEKAWNFVGDAATSAWDKMLGIGRERTTKDKIADIERTLIDFQLNPAKEGVYSYDTGLTAEDLRNDLKKLKEQDFLESISAAREKAERDEDERQKRRIAQNDALRKTFENAEEKHQRKINEIKNKYAYADSVIIDKAIEAENKRYKEEQEREKRKGASSGSKSYSDDAATKLLLESQKRLASLREQFSATNQLTEQEKRLAEFSQQITDLKEKRTLTADQKSVLARADEIQKSLELEASESRRLKNVQDIAKGHETALKFIQQQEASMAAMQNSAGLSNREAQRNREREQTQMMKASPEDRDLALSKLEERYKLEDELRGDWLMGGKTRME
ncbi:Phage-related minor tail protein [Leminorella grimontii]|uniref:phage tail length tape measure family protein n=1 Tax=Leminorella grimontii TaxID=82981 RepID=UPI00106A9216|nr:phage tail length tape measure family protein [Leminorella grimontii]VFS60041.1 Phage-related minor tail protein [Leminorella grimontii]